MKKFLALVWEMISGPTTGMGPGPIRSECNCKKNWVGGPR